MATYSTLRLVLGDQLNYQHSWYQQSDDTVVYLLAEMRSETDYVEHHVQKVVGFFLAMRQFADWLTQQGHQVIYLRLDDERNRQSVAANVRWLVAQYAIEHFAYQLPDEWRLDQELQQLAADLPILTQAVDTEHFLSERGAVQELFRGKKTYLMETFYRSMRRRYNLLMEADGETPLTGRWNYDQANRNAPPAAADFPKPPAYGHDARPILTLLRAQGVRTMGRIPGERFDFPINRTEALAWLEHFVEQSLFRFGDYQDAMTERDPLLYHAKLSFALNTKMLSPLEVVSRAIDYWTRHRDQISINQIEGFVRQIVGWREYMRGVYWAQMPAYETKNFFNHSAPLPDWYWTGDTQMNCLHHAVNASLDGAYAHHIQRLMITGNFALLLGADPDAVDAWYLGVYIDAIQWVEITNTRGMSQWADGGLIATKPYVSSANYIHKMSDYCTQCVYDRKARTGPNACPFNSLYWDFLDRHADKLRGNFRMGMVYRVWEKFDAEERVAILERAQEVKERANEL